MTPSDEMRGLIERIEGAGEGSRELDMEITVALDLRPDWLNRPEATDEMIAMARRAVAKIKIGASSEDILAGYWDGSPVIQAYLAAVIETTELAAKLVQGAPVTFRSLATYTDDIREGLAEALRNAAHLKGPDNAQ